jgi:hypothetical protein
VSTSTKSNLAKVPLIPPACIARALGSGEYAMRSATERLGIKPTRMPNRRELLTFEQAEAISAEMHKRAAR